jgi:hypothetical protein
MDHREEDRNLDESYRFPGRRFSTVWYMEQVYLPWVEKKIRAYVSPWKRGGETTWSSTGETALQSHRTP